jgi:hypothetical protein
VSLELRSTPGEVVRALWRMPLRAALDGTSQDRLVYALQRIASLREMQFMVHGRPVLDDERDMRLALHWHRRLDRLACR